MGFVPTMGALHEGHLSLVREARRNNDIVVVSIFVNPTQFGANEDYNKYPKTLKNDARLLLKEKTNYLFCPSAVEMYHGSENKIFIEIDKKTTSVLCGKYRPGHFRGVATVVAKLLNIVGECDIYMGEKDYQQTVVIEQMIEGLNINATLYRAVTVRENDGLAMSSRNRYLNNGERVRAARIWRILFDMRLNILDGRQIKNVIRRGRKELLNYVDSVQYLEVFDTVKLERAEKLKDKKSLKKNKNLRIFTACFVGKTRLIDNVSI